MREIVKLRVWLSGGYTTLPKTLLAREWFEPHLLLADLNINLLDSAKTTEGICSQEACRICFPLPNWEKGLGQDVKVLRVFWLRNVDLGDSRFIF